MLAYSLQLLQLKGQIILFIQLASAINYRSWIKFSQRPQRLSLTSNRCSKTATNTHSTGGRQHLRVPQLILIKESKICTCRKANRATHSRHSNLQIQVSACMHANATKHSEIQLKKRKTFKRIKCQTSEICSFWVVSRSVGVQEVH